MKAAPCAWSGSGPARCWGSPWRGAGALLWRLAQLMNQGWSPKLPAFAHFGRAAAVLYQALCTPAILLLALPLCLTQLRKLASRLRTAMLWPYPTMGILLALLSGSLGCKLGGPVTIRAA